MYVPTPTQHDPRPTGQPWWLVIGPGFAALIGLFLLTVIYRFDGESPLRIDLGISSQALLLNGLVSYLIAAAIAFPAGLLLGARFPTSVTVPALVLMLMGVLLVAFVPGSGLLLVGRVLNGLGAGAVLGVTVALIRRLRTGRGIAAGVAVGLGVLALAIAPVLGGLLSDATGFRVVYVVAALFVLVALVVAGVLGIVTLAKPKPLPHA
ncbi:MFS transporter [Amycolatopsis keratiniphila]|uniref:MFS transporter n=1 Tax=Amycolatopsis keratiniphila TaxID=129921 RepID=UPI00087CE323|nr:MFS transporter [Amycolatopsis keratiniphila]OLZ46625.1 multidrug transporter [Amycolatopsis keratiniphila subsp. nogabecina]SDU41316.1 Major Facilitator Superfamily protein [Amycolatopsis keratiniphila]